MLLYCARFLNPSVTPSITLRRTIRVTISFNILATLNNSFARVEAFFFELWDDLPNSLIFVAARSAFDAMLPNHEPTFFKVPVNPLNPADIAFTASLVCFVALESFFAPLAPCSPAEPTSFMDFAASLILFVALAAACAVPCMADVVLATFDAPCPIFEMLFESVCIVLPLPLRFDTLLAILEKDCEALLSFVVSIVLSAEASPSKAFARLLTFFTAVPVLAAIRIESLSISAIRHPQKIGAKSLNLTPVLLKD